MRIAISHDTTYRYATPARSVIQTLRLTPRNHEGQYVFAWGLTVSADCKLDRHEDAFGNVTHSFTADGPIEELTVHVEGQVEIENTHGVVQGAIERFPPGLFLRETSLTEADDAIAAVADQIKAEAGSETLSVLHALALHLHDGMTFDANPTSVVTTAREAFALKRGVCQDFTHIFIAAARRLSIPARYVSGYFCRGDGVTEQDAGHAWAEALVPDLGWVAFDPTNGISATDQHLRVAVGLDYLSAAPVRGAQSGGSGEALSVRVLVDQAMRQMQS
jgi:transglutaminase-like putative cysteine protease